MHRVKTKLVACSLLFVIIGSVIYGRLLVAPFVYRFVVGVHNYLTLADNLMKQTSEEWSRIYGLEQRARSRLREFVYAENLEGVIESVFFIDNKGTVVYAEPSEYSSAEGFDLSNQEHIANMLQSPKPILSYAFLAVEGMQLVVMAHPVFTVEGEFIGSVSAALNPNKIGRLTVEKHYSTRKDQGNFPTKLNFEQEFCIVQPDGRILFNTLDGEVGSLLQDSPVFANDEDNTRVLHRILKNKSGKDEVSMPAKNDSSKDTPIDQSSKTKGNIQDYLLQCSWDTVELHGAKWRILAFRNVY